MLSAKQLPIEYIVLDAPAADTSTLYRLIGALVAVRCGRGGPSVEQVITRLRGRHTRQSAAIGNGFALPHAAVPALSRVHALYLRTDRAVSDMPTPDGEPVTDVLVLLVPLSALAGNQGMLDEWHDRLRDRRVTQALRNARTAEQVQALLLHGEGAGEVVLPPVVEARSHLAGGRRLRFEGELAHSV